jgi:hypothetical protein
VTVTGTVVEVEVVWVVAVEDWRMLVEVVVRSTVLVELIVFVVLVVELDVANGVTVLV